MLGIGLLIIGAGLYVGNQGTQILFPVAQVTGLMSQGVSITPIISSTLLSVPASNYTYLTTNLKENIRTSGLLQVEGGSEIGFYVMNEGNFSAWSHGYPSVTNLAKPDAINYNFTFVPDVSEVYYFVFSNQDPVHKNVLFTLKTVESTTIPSPFIQYADFEMLMLGVLLTIVAVKTGKKHPKYQEPKDESNERVVNCKFCGEELMAGELFCSKCGRSQS
jgi:hypothetical protein